MKKNVSFNRLESRSLIYSAAAALFCGVVIGLAVSRADTLQFVQVKPLTYVAVNSKTGEPKLVCYFIDELVDNSGHTMVTSFYSYMQPIYNETGALPGKRYIAGLGNIYCSRTKRWN